MIRNTQSVENIEENHRFLPFTIYHDQGIWMPHTLMIFLKMKMENPWVIDLIVKTQEKDWVILKKTVSFRLKPTRKLD